jgi:hypothetical protein
MDADSPKGYECQCCKKRHEFPLYVYAHWDEALEHTCECEARHEILRGKVRMTAFPPAEHDNAM